MSSNIARCFDAACETRCRFTPASELDGGCYDPRVYQDPRGRELSSDEATAALQAAVSAKMAELNGPRDEWDYATCTRCGRRDWLVGISRPGAWWFTPAPGRNKYGLYCECGAPPREQTFRIVLKPRSAIPTPADLRGVLDSPPRHVRPPNCPGS